MSETKVAFRCRACGFLETCGHAAECAVPHECRACHAGVVFGRDLDECIAHADCEPHKDDLAKIPREQLDKHHAHGGRHIKLKFGSMFLLQENWEVLADCTPGRLAELGLMPEQVEKHEPWIKGHHGREPAQHDRSVTEGVTTAEATA